MKNSFRFNIKELNRCNFIAKVNKEFLVTKAATLGNMESSAIIFANKLDGRLLRQMEELTECLLIIKDDVAIPEKVAAYNEVLQTRNPRLLFARIMEFIIREQQCPSVYREQSSNVVIGENVQIGENVAIEPFVFIDHNVVIGDGSVIKSGAKIRENVTVGCNCVIGENTVIGGQGLGTEKDELTGRNYRIPHIGGVKIGNHVEIGALTTILSGTIEPTIICDYVFIDDLNHIAHNCQIGKSSITAGCVEVSGSAKIGDGCFIAPNSTIRNGIHIGDHCFIGQATLVTKDLASGSTVAGNPAETLNRMKTWRILQNKFVDEFEG